MAVVPVTSFQTGLAGVRAYSWTLANGDQGEPILAAQLQQVVAQLIIQQQQAAAQGAA